MAIKRFEKVLNNLNELFSSVWVLLSDTTIYISNNPKLFLHYESQLRNLRKRLESSRNSGDTISEVRQEVAELRKALRLQGYNLKLGHVDLRIEGFRNDDAIAKGFERCVLYIMNDGDIRYTTGLSNHIDLEKAMEARMNTEGYKPVRIKHYLWYKWENRVLILSGGATETAEDFELFKEYVAENKDYLLRKMKKI